MTQGLLGLLALADVMDNRIKQRASADLYGAAVHLDVTLLSGGETVAKVEMAALLALGALHLQADLFGAHGVDVGDAHLQQPLQRVAIKRRGSRIGLHDLTALRIDEPLHSLVPGKHLPIALLTLAQRLLRPFADRAVTQERKQESLAVELCQAHADVEVDR